VLDERRVGLIVFGPMLRRSLAMVATLRREGQTTPRMLVVYRDDQREEVKRHMKGRIVADRYVIQSRIAKDLAPAASELWHGAGRADTRDLEDLPAAAMAAEGATREMSILELGGDEPPPTPAFDDSRHGEVLGAFDGSAFAEEQDDDLALEEVEEFEMLDDAMLEELPQGGNTLELSLDDLVEELEPVELSEEEAGETLEELDGAELIEELEAEELDVDALEEEAAAPAQDAEPLAEMVDGDDLIEEFELEPLAESPPPAVVASAEPTAAAAAAEELELELEEVLAEELEAEPEVAAALAAAVVVATTHPVAVAPLPEPIVEVAPVVEVAPPPPSKNAMPAFEASPQTRQSRPQSGATAMMTELTGFVERLQEMSDLATRLEADNEVLRTELARARDLARPELETELRDLRTRLSELELRLEGAEGAREVAVEARMKADQAMRSQDDDIARIRAELTAANGQGQDAVRLQGELGAAKNRESTLEAQVEARRRLGADAARTLRQLAQMLDS
jgi:hypothetical protein